MVVGWLLIAYPYLILARTSELLDITTSAMPLIFSIYLAESVVLLKETIVPIVYT
jgi:hypothetical protein